jgi:hypothetical protein
VQCKASPFVYFSQEERRLAEKAQALVPQWNIILSELIWRGDLGTICLFYTNSKIGHEGSYRPRSPKLKRTDECRLYFLELSLVPRPRRRRAVSCDRLSACVIPTRGKA